MIFIYTTKQLFQAYNKILIIIVNNVFTTVLFLCNVPYSLNIGKLCCRNHTVEPYIRYSILHTMVHRINHRWRKVAEVEFERDFSSLSNIIMIEYCIE